MFVFLSTHVSCKNTIYLNKKFHRCLVSECEDSGLVPLDKWLPYAIPSKLGLNDSYTSENCYRYKVAPKEPRTETAPACSLEHFTTDVIKCNQWKFTGNERTIVNDVS